VSESPPRRDVADVIDFDPPTENRGHRFLTGTAYIWAAQAVKMIVQFSSVVVMSRLLAPDDFGLVAMAAPILTFAMMFADLGLGQATLQRERLTQLNSSSLFWVNVVIGFSICGLLFLIQPVVSGFYGDPRVGHITAALGLTLLLASVGAQHGALLNRRMRFGVLAMLDMANAILALLGSAAAALAGAGYWSLVIGPLFAGACSTACLWIVGGWRPSWPQRDNDLRSMLGFGGGITGFNLANFFSRNLDNILIGWRWGPTQLGLYDRAYKLLLFPLQQVTNPLSRIMVPTLSRLVNDPAAYRRVYIDVFYHVILITAPGVIALVATADIVIPWLMGERWGEVVPIFLALGLIAVVQCSSNPTGWLFITQARTREFALWGVFTGVTCAATFWFALPYGAVGVAIAYSVVEFIKAPIVHWYVTRKGPVSLGDVLSVLAPHVLWACVAVATLFGLRRVGEVHPAITVVVSLVLSYGIALAFSLAFPRTRESLLRSYRLINSFVATRLAPKPGAAA
jgi:PST family polysaccharide transporter